MLVGAPLVKEDLPPYEPPPAWIPLDQRRGHPDYDNDLYQYLPRSVTIKRTKATDTLGFNIRGGKNMGCGIFISKVLAESEAYYSGLKEGDQILWVNDTNFEEVDHTEAVRVLKSSTDINMTVIFFPFGYEITYERTKDINLIQQQLRSNAAESESKQETPGGYSSPPGGQREEQFQTRPPQGYSDQFHDSQSRNQFQERGYDYREATPQQSMNNMGYQDSNSPTNQAQRYPDPQNYPTNTRTPPGTQSPYQQFREMNQSYQSEQNPQYRQDRYDGLYPQRNERDWH